MENKVIAFRRLRMAALGAFILAVLLAGCAAIGPPTVDRDRFEYVSAISESWKRQTLLNLLKTRYLDAPVFMEIASVINQFALEGELELGLEWGDEAQALTATTTYTDRPTISYAPLTGEKFARSLLRPLPLGTIMLLVQAGYPIDQLLQICIQGINGLDNRANRYNAQNADPEFYEVLWLLRQIQKREGMRMRSRLIDNKETMVIFFGEPQTEAETLQLERALHLLGLSPEAREFRVMYGFLPENDNEIAILSRSLIQIMSEYASYIEVPDSDIAEGRVSAHARESAETESRFPPLIRVRSGASKPDDAFVAVPYRKHWFWIDDRDLHSKRTFYFLMIMFSFTERGETGQAAPILTVPTN